MTIDKPLILIVDDVEVNRLILKDVILEMDCIPLLAESGEQAFMYLERCNVAVAILDVAMPEMDGYEVCEKMKENPKTRNIPIIFVSAFDETEAIIKGFSVGGEDYITKPIIREVVKARVGVQLKVFEATQNMTSLNHQLHVTLQEQRESIEREKKNVLYAFGRVAREHSSYEERHMERLATNCRILSEALQISKAYESLISDRFIDTIAIAAPLCDIGNVSIPEEIFRKTEALSEDEIKRMQAHTTAGARILTDVSDNMENTFLQMAIDIANFHHERWDGTGYPMGLKENEIPLPAQIVSVVNSFCSMTEERAYRGSYSVEGAVANMEEESGTKFNQDIFNVMKKIYRQLV